MAGTVRVGSSGFSSPRQRIKPPNPSKGENVDNKNAEDLLNHVQSLRGGKTLSPTPEEQPAPLPVPPPVPPPAPALAPALATPPPTPTPIQQGPGTPQAYVPQPPQPVKPAFPLNQEQMIHLMTYGLPLSVEQMQYLGGGYPAQLVLTPQQCAALGMAHAMPPMPAAPPMQAMWQQPAPSAPPPPKTGGLFTQFEEQMSQVGVTNFDYIDQKKTSIKFGIIGAGQGGSRIAEAFYHLGYPVCVVNTAQHDLQNINIPAEQKLLLKVGAGGAGKNLQEGLDAAKDYAEDILDLMKTTFPRDVEHILVCAGGGGGSGSGGLPKIIDMAKVMGVPVGVIFTIPKDSEGSRVKENAHDRLMLLDKRIATGEISPLILVDNNKIHEFHVGVSTAKFWRIANAQIAGLFHLFNVLSAQNSAYSSLDPADYKTIIQSKGCLIFGSTTVEDSSRPTAVSKALRENISKGLLAEGFDLSLSNIAGVIVTGSQALMESLPQENVDAAAECLGRIVGGGTLHSGIYVENVDKLTVYTIVGGLPLPDARVKKLLKS